MGNLAWKALSAVHRPLYRVGVGRRLLGVPILQLTTKGRRSGREITTMLPYFEDGTAIYVIASKGGAAQNPAWYLNLVADPDVMVRIGNRASPYHAEAVSDPGERDRLYAIAVKANPGYSAYERKTQRKIPVVRLDRLVSSDGSNRSSAGWPGMTDLRT